MGTLSFDMKLPNMRKEQDFIVYPASEKTDYITIQSGTRFGKIEMTTGRGLMSQSHANGAYAVHMHIDKLVKFQLTDSQLEKLKEELAKTAGSSVGRSVVISDNSYADKFASGGYVEEGEDYEYVNTFGIDQDDFEKLVDAYHKSPSYDQAERVESRLTFSKMREKYGESKIDEIGNYIHETHESHEHYAKGGTFGAGNFADGGETDKVNIDVKTIGENKYHIDVNGKSWSKKSSGDLGDVIINVLFYVNKEGDKKIKIMIDGKDETVEFKKAIIERYEKGGLKHLINYLGEGHKYAKGGMFGAGRFASGGELVDKTIDHDGRYLHLVGNHRMLHIHLNNEGREMIMDERESGRGDEEIMYDLFEDIVGNSTLMYHTDLGESGFGMTSSSGVTYDYGYDDNGDLVPLDDNAVVYVDNDSYRRSPVEELLEGRLIMRNSDFMARGGKLAGAGRFASGGELVDKTIDHDGRYLHLVGNHRMLHIHLNNEGREMIMDERESGRGDEEIMYDLFEDIVGNSTLMYHTDLGESGFGMTSSSGVTYDYGYDDNGDLVPLDDNAVVYVDNDSYRRSPVEELLEGRLIMRNSDFMARGGRLAGAGQFAKGTVLKMGKDDFSFLLGLSDKELSKRLDLIRKQQGINGEQYLKAREKGESTKAIEEAGERLAKQERAIIEARMRK
jgi:hypothetical protein